jgi:PAS domain S-box-containing protein
MWIGPDGNILYISPSCERITGYKPQEFSANPGLMTSIVHPDDHALYAEHLRITHDKASGVEDLELRLVVRNGEERWIEHICRPVFGENERFMGRRISNRDITLRKIAEREIEERNLKENLLTQTIRTMQLDIARDLHDTIGQNISFLRMKLDHLSSKTGWTKAILLNELETMKKAANESYDLIRGTLVVLQSGASPDLFNIFTRYAEQVEERSDVRIEFSLEGDARPISPKRMRQLFYIFREILTNIEKHAQAQHVSIKVGWGDESLDLEVCDDGVGFDPENIQFGGHYGLRFMRERVELLNGSLNIQSAAGAGTNLEVRVPYE